MSQSRKRSKLLSLLKVIAQLVLLIGFLVLLGLSLISLDSGPQELYVDVINSHGNGQFFSLNARSGDVTISWMELLDYFPNSGTHDTIYYGMRHFLPDAWNQFGNRVPKPVYVRCELQAKTQGIRFMHLGTRREYIYPLSILIGYFILKRFINARNNRPGFPVISKT